MVILNLDADIIHHIKVLKKALNVYFRHPVVLGIITREINCRRLS